MRVEILALLIALAPGALAAQVTFDSGWDYKGESEAANATMMLLVWPPGADLEFDLHLPEAVRATEFSTSRVTSDGPVPVVVDHEVTERPATTREMGSLETLVTPTGGWGSSFIVAENIHVAYDLGGGGVTPEEAPPQATLASRHPFPAGTVRSSLAYDAGPLVSIIAGGAGQARVQVTGLQVAEFHNVTFDCNSECAFAAGYSGYSLGGGGAVGLQEFGYARFETRGGRLSGQADTAALMVRGSNLGLNVSGAVRLPIASCVECDGAKLPPVENRTLLLVGTTYLRHIEPSSGRMSAGVQGTWANIRVDETWTSDPTPKRIVIASAAAAVVGATWLVKLVLVQLATRRGNKTRAAIVGLVQERPGIRFSEIMREMGIGNGTVDYHLHKLVQARGIDVEIKGSTKFYFPARTPKHLIGPLLVLQDSCTKRLLAFLGQVGISTQAQAIEFGGEQLGISRSAVQRRLRQLMDAGLLAAATEGRTVAYSACNSQTIESGQRLDLEAGIGEVVPA